MKHVLVDYENIQPATLASIVDAETRVVVFLGPTQTKVCSSLVKELQAMGHGASYEQIEQAGPNALDFVLAFRIGELAANDASAEFLIVSHDGGYDALICHLRKMGRQASRTGLLNLSAEVAYEAGHFGERGKAGLLAHEVEQFDRRATDLSDDGIEIESLALEIVAILENQPNRPKSRAALKNQIRNSHREATQRFGVEAIYAALIRSGFIRAGLAEPIYQSMRKKRQ